ncbi:hypothetical protein [Bradyrhizobium sp. AUGA SZCCT0431]|uniref:hypothetical protein n=1 Tax=Bradyrhizobium sp. AUGA SZCCT0431 TaxID=2807674 RepID=UPI00201359B8|nr:hypothetical protein [Bradyrhizobium sp. AUGA SZCCT0431]
MDDEFRRQLLERLKSIERQLDALDTSQSQLKEAYARSRAHARRLWLRPPMWTFEQHPPRPLDLRMLPAAPRHGRASEGLRRQDLLAKRARQRAV